MLMYLTYLKAGHIHSSTNLVFPSYIPGFTSFHCTCVYLYTQRYLHRLAVTPCRLSYPLGLLGWERRGPYHGGIWPGRSKVCTYIHNNHLGYSVAIQPSEMAHYTTILPFSIMFLTNRFGYHVSLPCFVWLKTLSSHVSFSIQCVIDKGKHDSVSKRLSMDPTARVALSKLELVRESGLFQVK